jgi:peptidoglycan hydrolase-like protein with peptidoglycan-binding domain
MQTLKVGSSGSGVTAWQQYLNSQGYSLTEDGNFGVATEAATKDFQQKHGLVVDGEVGPITFNFTESLYYPAPNIIKSNSDVLLWIKQNLNSQITVAVQGSYFSDDWLAAIACRETGGLITKYVNQGNSTVALLAPLMKGDFTDGQYHGFSFWQIDIRSFPTFITSGDWLDVQKSASKAVSDLQTMRQSLLNLGAASYNLSKDVFDRAITASFNAGSGNVIKMLRMGIDVDQCTTGGNYSQQVFSFRLTYTNLGNSL